MQYIVFMAKTAMINARIEPKLKEEVDEIFDELGLTTTEAVTLFFKRVKNYRGLPFEVRLPNAETHKAIEQARKGKVRRFRSIKDLKAELDR
jgi:DNA-damage-inducible protein J